MSASNFGDGMEWGRGRSSPSSSGSKRGKRGGSSVDKPRQPQRGLGVAQLEKIRLQSEMAEYLHHPHLTGQQPPSSIHQAAGGFNLQEDAWSSSASSSFHTNNINIPRTNSIHPNIAMAYNGGRSGDMRYGESPSTTPISRSTPNYHGAAIYEPPHYSHPNNDGTLSFFEPEDSIEGQCDLNHSLRVDPSFVHMNLDDPQDVDLELKL